MKNNIINRSTTLAVLAACAMTARVFAADAPYDEDASRTIRYALQDVSKSIQSSPIPAGEPISVLPIANDIGYYVEGLLKSAVTDAGKNYVEGNTDPFWNQILEDTEWVERKRDMLDQNTLVQFGKLQATRILIYGTVRTVNVTENRVYVEIELHASSLLTKQHLWGRTFTKTLPLRGAKTIDGLTAIPVDTRVAMQEGIKKQAVASMQKQRKLAALKTAELIPLAGDIDAYATCIVRDAVSLTDINPKEGGPDTLLEARQMISRNPDSSNGILSGALRDFSQVLVSRSWYIYTYAVTAEVQACIENASGEILWSDTLLAAEQYQVRVSLLDWLYMDVIPYLQANPLVWIIPLAIVLGWIVIRMFFRATQRKPR